MITKGVNPFVFAGSEVLLSNTNPTDGENSLERHASTVKKQPSEAKQGSFKITQTQLKNLTAKKTSRETSPVKAYEQKLSIDQTIEQE